MAELVVGGWFASAAINKLADKARDYLEGQFEYEAAVEDNLKKLQRKLTLMQAVIYAAEQQRQTQNPSLKIWLRDLKDAAFDAEDLLDKFDYQLLEAKVEEQNKVRDNFASSSLNLAATHAKTFVKRLVFRDDDIKELREIVKRFDDISSDMGHFLVLMKNDVGGNKQDEKSEGRQKTSVPDKPEIVGREIVIKNIVNSLVGRSDNSRSSNEIFSVLSIVGIGGVGKTTVAQHVFKNNKIKEYFDLKIWVCVSETFDVRRLTIEIIIYCCKKEKEMIRSASSALTLNDHHLMNLETIQEILGEKLDGKRFLIVLDDIWNEVRSKWETLCKPFKFGKEGSRIIVTTRSHAVAAAVGTKEKVDLEGLAEEDFCRFFNQCAFGDAIQEHHPKLELIGRKIAKKLGGLPLAAKTVGSILNSKLKEEDWRGVLESKLWEIEQQEDEVMPALQLSYDFLPARLKQCFAYCSLFPKDYPFVKEKLVQLWMAHGFVRHEKGKRPEDIGVQYFDDLLQRCFFQKADEFKYKYKIHDLLHDLAESVSDHECCRIETDGPVEISKRARHLYIDTNHQLEKCELEICEKMGHIKKLRSLVVVDKSFLLEPFNSGLIDFIQYILKKSKQLRVLIFFGISFQFSLEATSDLEHLRYIEIVSCPELNWPESCCKLYHLQALHRESAWMRKSWLPKDLNNCINLRHLSGGFLHTSNIIDGIGKLTCLQELEYYYVKDKYGHRIGELRNLRKLRGRLWIHNLDNVKNKEEASEAMLHNKKHLKFLGLEWGFLAQDHMADVHEEIIEGLQPHINLRKLDIVYYGGITSPSWLSKAWLSNLEDIRLCDCYAWAVLPPFGQLPFLKTLFLKGMRSVKKIGTEFYGSDDDDTAFLSLKVLVFQDMDEWEEWSGPRNYRLLFPCLQQLSIYKAQNLRRTLVIPTPSKEVQLLLDGDCISIRIEDDMPSPSMLKIHIYHSSPEFIWSFSKAVLDSIKYMHFNNYDCIPSFTDIEEERFQKLTSLISFTEMEEEWFQKLTSLKALTFFNCHGLQLFPTNMTSLTSLESLEIIKCPNIERLPKKGLPKSLKVLDIRTCEKLEARCQINDGHDWSKISYIPHITIGETTVRSPNEAAPLRWIS